MRKTLLYIIAAVITALSTSFNIVRMRSLGEYYMIFGIAAAAALLLFGEAWKRGKDPEKPFYQVVLFSLGGLASPVIAEILIRDIDDFDFSFLAGVLLFLAPIISASVIGYFTRKREYSENTRILLNGIPGLCLVGCGIWVLVSDASSIVFHIFQDLGPIVFIALVVILSAYAEAQIDPVGRRKVQWNAWRLIFLLEILVGVKSYSSGGYFLNYYFYVFNTILRIMMPLFLWYWKKWLWGKEGSQTVKTICYFGGAFLLIVLQSGGLYDLITTDYLILSAEWMLIGTVLTLAVYWQKPMKMTVSGVAGGAGFAIGLFGLLFATNERLREIFYDLGGPAIDIDLSTRADWLGYRINAVKAFFSGDYHSMSELYSRSFGYDFWKVQDSAIPYILPLVLALFVLTVIAAVLMTRLAQNRELAKVVAIGMTLHALVFGIEAVVMYSGTIWLPFAGYYVAEFVMLRWMVNPMTSEQISSENTTVPTEGKHTRIKMVIAALLVVMTIGECGYKIYLRTDIDKKVLDTYSLTDEDMAEWNAAAEQIVQMIVAEHPYYIAANRTELSAEESEEWQEACIAFAKEFLATDQLQPESARDMAGQRYIKGTVVHTLLGDDTNFSDEAYTPFARLQKIKVKRMESSWKLLFWINGAHAWIKYSDFTEAEQAVRELLYDQVETDYAEFFREYDELVLRYCFADAVLALQAQ